MSAKVRSKRTANRKAIHRAASAVFEGLESRLLMHAHHDQYGEYHEMPAYGQTADTNLVVKPTTKKYTSIAKSGHLASKVMATLPMLNSNPDATAQLYLDFDGAASMSWGSFTTTVTPAYSTDGDASNFSVSELNNINQIWARVAETYSPFNINVTTVDPGNLTDKVTTRMVIGGNGSWYGSAGGVAYVGGFYNTAPNIGWIFTDMLGNGNPKYTADAVAHEAGHTFGLIHQSTYSGSSKTAEYNPGTSAKAPIMGVSYYSTRALWWTGPSSAGASATQTDLTILTNSNNGFGYRADDHGGSIATASDVDVTDNTISGSGIIGQITDKDYFSFSTLTGNVSFTVSPATYGGMLDATISLVNSAGTVITSANTTSLGETISANLSAGQYFLIVGSKGATGDIGQFSLTGTIVTSPNYVAPPASVTATATNGQVSLHWTDMSWNETGFVIERSANGGADWTTVTTTDAGTTSYIDTDASPGAAYAYRMMANGESEDSTYSSTATVNLTPAAPSGLSALTDSATQIDLSWNNVSGETSFRVERSTNNSTWATLATLSANVTEYSNTGLAGGTKYYYRVIAICSVGNSSPTASVNATTKPAAPATISASSSVSSITITWTNVAGETGYKLERSANGSDWSLLTTTAVNVATYSNNSLSSDTLYYYRVKATNAGGDSTVSSTVSKRTLLPAPTGLTAEVEGTTEIDLSWAESTGATGYRVEKLSGTTWVQIGTDLDDELTSYNVTGLVAGASYSFRIRAINDGGLSLPGTTATATTIPPAATTITSTALSTSQIKLTWTNIAGETGYKIERSLNGSSWSQIATTAVNVATYTNTTLDTDTLYYYRVKAYNAAGDGSASGTASTRTLLDAPTGLEPSVFSTTQINLSWDDSEGETGYKVERLNGTTWVQVGATLSADTTESIVTGLVAGTSYSFRVKAVNSGGTSNPSSIVTATTIPAIPTLAVATFSDTAIKLSWTNVAGETGYKIERSDDGSDWSQIATTAVNIVSYTDSGLDANATYYYRVRASNAAGNSVYSSSINKTTFIAVPSGLSASATSATTASLEWEDSDGETGYRVERLSGTAWVQVGSNLAADTTSLSVTGLAGGTAYSFRVRAINAGGLSLPSATSAATTMPAAPLTVVTTLISGNNVKVSWSNVTGETGFKIERSTDGMDWEQIGTVGVNVLTYTNTAVDTGTYYYRVKAYNASGDSVASTTATRTV